LRWFASCCRVTNARPCYTPATPPLQKRIKDILETLSPLQIAPNLRPTIDLEDLSPATESASALVGQVRTRQLGGLAALANVSGSPPLPAPYTMGRVLRFLSKASDPTRGVLGIDMGSGWLTTAAGLAGSLVASVQPVGVDVNRAAALERFPSLRYLAGSQFTFLKMCCATCSGKITIPGTPSN